MEVVTDLQCEEPNVDSDNKDCDTVRDEHPVQENEADGDMIPLYDGEYGETERH